MHSHSVVTRHGGDNQDLPEREFRRNPEASDVAHTHPAALSQTGNPPGKW